MSVFEPSPEAVAEVHAIREVRLGMASHVREETVSFYRDILGLPAWESARNLPGCIGLGHARRGLLLESRHDPEVDEVRRRMTLTVPDLELLTQRLDELSWAYERVRGFGFADHRIVVHDPAGHRIEVRQFRPL